VKNTLATVQSVVNQTLRRPDAPAGVREALESRLLALSSAPDVLTDEHWSGADLLSIAKRACAPFGGDLRFKLMGPSVRLSPRIAIALALAFHELATNATKYGALSRPEGRVSVTWDFTGGDEPELAIQWRETGGPPVTPPSRRGFGSRMIERSLAAEMGGRVVMAYPPEGLACDFAVRMSDAVLRAKGTRLQVARDGDSWTVADGDEVLQWFETQADAIAYLTEQLNALRVKGQSGTVIFNTSGPNDPPRRRPRPPRTIR
jgi:two-component sensor histidine kinase